MNELIDKFLLIYEANTADDALTLCFVFCFGNLGISLLSGIFCLIFERISKFIYDFFGYILTSSLADGIFNIVLIVFLAATAKFRIVFCAGLIITIFSYIFIAYKFSYLNGVGSQTGRWEK